jgi:nitrile hydratase subunit beta
VDSIADMGGMQGLGSVHYDPGEAASEPPFQEPWEGRAFALTLLAINRISGQNLDAMRHALDRLHPIDYLVDGYYGRWLNCSEVMLIDSGIIAPGAIDARARRLRGEDVEEPPTPEPNKPDYSAAGPGSLRQIDEEPRFKVGQTVRAKDIRPTGHTRLPRYIRGRTGVVERLEPPALLPDTHAHFLGENPQHVYNVAFDSRELWGPDAEPFTLNIDCYESYLEEAP